jgi:putative peptidoglycan lipid II flippase
MTERRRLAHGDVLANRYELQDLVAERLGASSWRAHDSVLHRNVGLELLDSDDPRAEHFLEAARMSTAVSDPRFLRILDLLRDERGHHVVVREWARAFPLDALLRESPLPNRRAAEVIAEVAEALAHAHSRDLYHRRLMPHQVLLKQSGAVRIVGLGVATALASVDQPASFSNLAEYERLDVQALGQLLYACLTSRWPGGEMDGLLAAPLEHDRVLRPQQVRAGVSRELDAIYQRIAQEGPDEPLTTAADIAAVLRKVAARPSRVVDGDQDLLRLDPVVVPKGPPPGLEPPRPRPRAFDQPPLTPVERSIARARRSTQGDRKLVWIGVIGTFLIASIIAFLVGRATVGDHRAGTSGNVPLSDTVKLHLVSVRDFDPLGRDRQENPGAAELAIDDDAGTGWQTSTYLHSPELGGLKAGVGLVVDLGGPRSVQTVHLLLSGPTDVEIYASDPGMERRPGTLGDVHRVAAARQVGPDASIAFSAAVSTRFMVIWLVSLPRVQGDEFRGEIREIEVRGAA